MLSSTKNESQENSLDTTLPTSELSFEIVHDLLNAQICRSLGLSNLEEGESEREQLFVSVDKFAEDTSKVVEINIHRADLKQEDELLGRHYLRPGRPAAIFKLEELEEESYLRLSYYGTTGRIDDIDFDRDLHDLEEAILSIAELGGRIPIEELLEEI